MRQTRGSLRRHWSWRNLCRMPSSGGCSSMALCHASGMQRLQHASSPAPQGDAAGRSRAATATVCSLTNPAAARARPPAALPLCCARLTMARPCPALLRSWAPTSAARPSVRRWPACCARWLPRRTSKLCSPAAASQQQPAAAPTRARRPQRAAPPRLAAAASHCGRACDVTPPRQARSIGEEAGAGRQTGAAAEGGEGRGSSAGYPSRPPAVCVMSAVADGEGWGGPHANMLHVAAGVGARRKPRRCATVRDATTLHLLNQQGMHAGMCATLQGPQAEGRLRWPVPMQDLLRRFPPPRRARGAPMRRLHLTGRFAPLVPHTPRRPPA